MPVFRRPLIPCLFAFLLGLWLVHTILPAHPHLAIALFGVCAIAASAAWLKTRDVTPFILLLVILAGAFRILPVEQERKSAEALSAQLGSAPRVIQGVIAAAESLDPARGYIVLRDVTLTSATDAIAWPGKLKLSILAAESADVNIAQYHTGDTIQALAAVHPPRELHNFFGKSSRQLLALQQIYGSAVVRTPDLVQIVRPHHSLATRTRAFLANLRARVSQTLHATMPDHTARLLDCMLFNDMRQLSDDDARIFRDSGTMHLFAVSGMHVAIFALILNVLFRACRCTPRLSWILVLAVLFLYMVLLDFIPPAYRAFLMVLACTVGRILGREIDSLSALTFGTLLIIITDPLSPWQVGFQLSVMGVVAILLIVPLFKLWFVHEKDITDLRPHDHLLQWILESLNITLAVTLTLLPLQLYYFHQVNLLSPLANLLEAALAAPVLGAALLVAVAGFISHTMALIFGQAASAIMQLVYDIARWTAESDYAIVHTPEFPILLVLLFYLLLFTGYYIVHRGSPEYRAKARARFAVHGCSCIALVVASNAWLDSHRPLRIWFFDVGQGDSTFIQFPNGQNVLVDAGTNLPDMGRLVVLPQLKALGISRIDYVVATHPDSDHTGGIATVLQQYPHTYFVEPDETAAPDEITSGLRDLCDHSAIPIFHPSAGDTKLACDNCSLTILNPPRNEPERSLAKDNNRSVVLKITYGNFSALLMADAEAPVEQRLVREGLGHCTILKVGHHGSRTSSIPEFLRATTPELAVISCGENNRYHHPSPIVTDRLHNIGTRVLRTDLHGATLVESDGQSYQVITATEPGG